MREIKFFDITTHRPHKIAGKKGEIKVEGNEKSLEFSCKEARLLLGVIPIDKDYLDMVKEEQAALSHYLKCKTCMETGLSEITSKSLSCREALEIWAEKSSHLGFGNVDTLKKRLAAEHVLGRWKYIYNKDGSVLYINENFEACKEFPCSELRHYWLAAPLSCFYDGEREAAGAIPFIMDLFIKQKWPVGRLFKIQRQRISMILEGLLKNELPLSIGQGNCHTLEDGKLEIEKGVLALQEIILAGLNKK